MSTRKFNNFTQFIEENGFRLISDLDEFNENSIRFQCQKDHVIAMSVTSFANKKAKLQKEGNCGALCSKCFVKGKDPNERFEKIKAEVEASSGHVLLELRAGKKCVFRCGSCGAEKESEVPNLMRSTGACSSCKGVFRKKTEDEVEEELRDVLENLGLEPTRYRVVRYMGNKVVDFECDKNHLFRGSFSGIKRGRGCPSCAPDRRAETNLKKYGTKCVFQNEEIKAKIRATNLERFGVEYPLQNEQIRKNVEETMMAQHGIRFAFNSKECFEKIRARCVERFGVEYPLQNAFIQAKISETFLRSIGATRPMGNQEWWKQKMMDKFGVEHYSKTPEFPIQYKNTCLDRYGVDNYAKTPEFPIQYKNTCLDRYGVDHWFKSEDRKQHFFDKYGVEHYSKTPEFWDKYKRTCLDKYGVEYPMQNASIFSKWQGACFRKKPFTFPSGRVDFVLGYEPDVLRLLIKGSKIRAPYHEDTIITDPMCMPLFTYDKLLKDDTERKAVYFPDIMLPDKFIEVKSEYTFKLDQENMFRKCDAVKAAGYNIEIWVVDKSKPKKTLFVCPGRPRPLEFEE
jgi:hypothetical protein